MRIMMMGGGQRYHLEPLARCIKRADPNVWLGVNDLCDPSDDGSISWLTESSIFDQVFQTPRKSNHGANNNSSNAEGGNGALQKSLELAPWLMTFKVGWRLFKRRLPRRGICRHHEQLSKNSDLLHLQSIFVSNSLRWLVANAEQRYIVSIWGSDLLRRSSLEEYILQQRVLRNATAITASTPEMQEVLLAKYGRELEAKLATTYFNPEVEPFGEMARAENEISRYDGTKIFKVCIGHNGMEGGNHERLLNGFAALPPAQKERIELILPMTYGASQSYLRRVAAKAENTGCRTRILSTFMTDHEVRKLRAEADILVFAPVSDALSATVTQAFACGSAVVCGSWLSYRARVRAGFRYREIAAPEDAVEAVASLMANWTDEVPHLLHNKRLAFSLFSEQAIGAQWVEVYQKAINNQTKN